MSKKLICCMIALLLLSVCLPVLAETAGPVPALLPSVRTPVSGMDGADAFAGYVNRVFGIGGASAITPRNASLTGFNKAIYDLLVPLIEDTAAGNIASSVFTVDVSDAAAQLGIQPDDLMYSPEDLGLSSFYDDEHNLSGEALNAYYQRAGFNMGTIVHALMVNLPYDLYWFDKTSGFSSGIHLYTTDEEEKMTLFDNGKLTLFMDVAQEFSAGSTAGTTDLNTTLTSAASSAAANAQSIVSAKAGLSDFAKLSAFKDAVCQRVSYNQDAADDDDMPYGNPWQLIWVFDDNPDTNVVCEGYSKAFKYLCDLSSFTNPDLSVSIVSGWMSGGTGDGAHMWNLVSMGSGANYLADITNCDEGSVGYPDELFMAGSGRPYSDNGLSGYIFSANGSDIVYAYDGDMAGLYTEAELTVSETAYVPPAGPQIVADGICGDDLTWTLDENGLLTVSGTGEMYGGWNEEENPWAGHKAEILHVVVEQGVTSLGLAAFRECVNLTDISLPDSLTHIGYQALSGCYSLTEVIIPDSVIFIGRWAFAGCPITSITIPASVTEIEFGAFSYCNQLEEINIAYGNPSYLVDEDGVLFTADQTKLLWYPVPRTQTSYTVPDTVTTLDGNAFSICNNLHEIILPAGLSTIGASAFDQCQNLTDVYYRGSQYRWLSIDCQDGNGALSAAQLHFAPVSGTCGENLTWALDGDGVLTISGTGPMTDYETDTAAPWSACRDEIVRAVIGPGVASLGAQAFHHCRNLTGVSLPEGLTAIGGSAFHMCERLADIDIPESVTAIDQFAFCGCYALTGIDIPANVASIGYGALSYCHSLAQLTVDPANTAFVIRDGVLFTADQTELVCYPPMKTGTSYSVPSAVTFVRDLAFTYCVHLENITLPDQAVLGNEVFAECAGLTSVSLPSALPAFTYKMFASCTSLTGLTIPSSVTAIESHAFQGCSSLTGTLVIPSSVTRIGNSAFQFCSGLTGLSLPSSLTSIGAWSFQNCSGIGSLTLPEGLTAIEDGAFSGCSGLTGDLIIPSAVTVIGQWAFSGCTGLNGTLTLPPSLTGIEAGTFQNCTHLTGTVTLPSSVACIGDLAFQYCEKLTGLSLSSSLTSIGGWSFQNCTGIVSPLALPEGLTAIADGAFSGCSGLTGNLVLPSTLTSLGRWVFSGCTGFSGYLQIPGSLPGIADATFYDCNGLTDIYYAGTADEWHAAAPNPGPYNGAALHFGAAVSTSGWFGTGNPFLWILDSRGHLLVRGSGDMVSFWDDQDIPWYPYRQDIFRLTVTPGVTGIGANAFKQLTRLISVFLPDGLEYIGGCAFDHCESLPEISLPESVATIDWYSFGSCYALTDIFIPRSLTTIGDAALAYCLELSQITVDADNPAFTTDDGVLLTMDRTELICYPPKKDNNFYFVPDTVTTIRTEAFSACENLSLIFLPPRLESIGESAFSWCSQLSQIRIPAGVTAIPQKAFSYCSSLTAIHIPESVRHIGNNAFYRCDRLAAVYYFGTQQEWNAVIIEDNNEFLTNAVLRIIYPDLILPAQLTAIESEAFAGVPEGSVIFVPDTVTAIAPDAFDPGTVIITPADSYAAGWAAENGFVCFEQ